MASQCSSTVSITIAMPGTGTESAFRHWGPPPQVPADSVTWVLRADICPHNHGGTSQGHNYGQWHSAPEVLTAPHNQCSYRGAPEGYPTFTVLGWPTARRGRGGVCLTFTIMASRPFSGSVPAPNDHGAHERHSVDSSMLVPVPITVAPPVDSVTWALSEGT